MLETMKVQLERRVQRGYWTLTEEQEAEAFQRIGNAKTGDDIEEIVVWLNGIEG